MALLFQLSKNKLSVIPGDPVRRALYLHILAWLLIGILGSLIVGSFFELDHHTLFLAACNIGGGLALGPGLIGGLYWWVNNED